MDFSAIFQLREKKFWWMDVIFYFVISSLIATVLCYFIFAAKSGMERKQIMEQELKLQEVGTQQQKEFEKEVINYQIKISDFAGIFKNHGFSSHVFAFMEKQTFPNVWFKQFTMNQSDAVVQVSGESDNMEAFARQVAAFEKNEYVKSLSSLNSSLGDSAKVQFNLNLGLYPKIFSYVPEPPVLENASSTLPAGIPPDSLFTGELGKSSDKLIISFNLPLNPEVPGVIDITNHAILLTVPAGTNVTSLKPLIFISPKAQILPASDIVQNFTNPVVYKVTAEDGSAQNYTVTVGVLTNQTDSQTKNKNNIFIIAGLIFIIIIVVSVAGFLAWKKMQKKKQELK